MSAHETLANTIRTRFNTEVALPKSLTVLYDNDTKDVSDDSIWCRLIIRENSDTRLTIGNSTSKYRTRGLVISQLFTQVNKGDGDLRNLADFIVTKFRSITVSGVSFLSPTIIPAGMNQDLTMWQMNINCPFYADNNY